jgi:hypothetical protein
LSWDERVIKRAFHHSFNSCPFILLIILIQNLSILRCICRVLQIWSCHPGILAVRGNRTYLIDVLKSIYMCQLYLLKNCCRNIFSSDWYWNFFLTLCYGNLYICVKYMSNFSLNISETVPSTKLIFCWNVPWDGGFRFYSWGVVIQHNCITGSEKKLIQNQYNI